MTRNRRTHLVVATAAALAAACWIGAGDAATSRPRTLAAPSVAALARDAGVPVRGRVLGRPPRTLSGIGVPPGFWGGPTASSSGNTTIAVYVSDKYPQDPAFAQKWVDLLEWLDHGPELERVTLVLAPPADVDPMCGAGDAEACYFGLGELIVAPGDGSANLSQVLAHEYAHHIAHNRSNPPWDALSWGPKYWASAVGVCKRTAQGAAYPGDEGEHYGLNPGEAWAETYRLAEVRRAQAESPVPDWAAEPIPWVVDRSLFPGPRAFAAALRDVTGPWTAPVVSTWTPTLRRGNHFRAAETITTPVDGTLAVRVTGGGATVSLSETATGRRLASSQSTLSRRICGTRSFRVRVTGHRAAAVRVTTVIP